MVTPATTSYDLERAFEIDAEREQLFARGGTLAMLLARLGAYDHHPEDNTDYHDVKGYGFPTANARKGRIALDPSLPFADYERLVPCGPRVREVIARHPSTPADVRSSLAAMGNTRAALELTAEELGSRPTASSYRVAVKLNDADIAAALAVCEAKGDRRGIHGKLADLLRRAGAFDYGYQLEDGVLEHRDWRGGARPRPNVVSVRAHPLDPDLPWDELKLLAGRGVYADALIAAHPARPPRAP